MEAACFLDAFLLSCLQPASPSQLPVLRLALLVQRQAARSSASTHCARRVTDETFYFVMADRFENGATTTTTGAEISGDRLQHGFNPTQGLFTKAAISRACWTGSITYRA